MSDKIRSRKLSLKNHIQNLNQISIWRTLQKIAIPGYKEEFNSRRRSYRAKHVDRERARFRRWYHSNILQARDSNKKRQKIYLLTNPVRYAKSKLSNNIQKARYRARLKNSICETSGIKDIYARCAELRSQGLDVAVDHVIPLAKGGKHSASNLQIIDRLENLHKGSKLDYKPIFVFV